MIGTPYYLAPEAIDGHSSIEADLWSLGVLIYVLLIGKYPFNGDNPSEIYQNIMDRLTLTKFFEGSIWENISVEAKDLISKLL